MAWKGFEDIQATIEINLSTDLDSLWNNLDKDARWGVKKAEKECLIIKEAEKKDWTAFYKIYKETIIAGGIVPKDKEMLKQETSTLFLCFKDNKMIAGAAVKIQDNKIRLFLNASKREYQKFQPNNLLYWHIIKYGKEKGFKIFDLGGYQLNTKPNDKLYHVNRFKERWGGKIKTYAIYSKNPFYILGRKIIRNFGFVKFLRDKLKLWLWKKKNEK